MKAGTEHSAFGVYKQTRSIIFVFEIGIWRR